MGSFGITTWVDTWNTQVLQGLLEDISKDPSKIKVSFGLLEEISKDPSNTQVIYVLLEYISKDPSNIQVLLEKLKEFLCIARFYPSNYTGHVQ